MKKPNKESTRERFITLAAKHGAAHDTPLILWNKKDLIQFLNAIGIPLDDWERFKDDYMRAYLQAARNAVAKSCTSSYESGEFNGTIDTLRGIEASLRILAVGDFENGRYESAKTLHQFAGTVSIRVKDKQKLWNSRESEEPQARKTT